MYLNLTLVSLSLVNFNLPFITSSHLFIHGSSPSYHSVFNLNSKYFFTPFLYSSIKINFHIQHSSFTFFLSTPLIFDTNYYHNTTMTSHLSIFTNTTINQCTFSNCIGDEGGALSFFSPHNCNISISSCNFYLCTAKTNSGVLYIKNKISGPLSFTNCVSHNCSSGNHYHNNQILTINSENEFDYPSSINLTTISFWFDPSKTSNDKTGNMMESYSNYQQFTHLNCTVYNKHHDFSFLSVHSLNHHLYSKFIHLDNFYCRYLFQLNSDPDKNNEQFFDFSYIFIGNLTQYASNGPPAVFYYSMMYKSDTLVSNSQFSNISVDQNGISWNLLSYDGTEQTINFTNCDIDNTTYLYMNSNQSKNRHAMIIVSVVVVVVLIVVAIVATILILKKRKKDRQNQVSDDSSEPKETNTNEIHQNVSNNFEEDPFKEDIKHAMENAATVL